MLSKVWRPGDELTRRLGATPRPGSEVGQRQGAASEELAEIKTLKAENMRLREDVAILKVARSFIGLDPRNR